MRSEDVQLEHPWSVDNFGTGFPASERRPRRVIHILEKPLVSSPVSAGKSGSWSRRVRGDGRRECEGHGRHRQHGQHGQHWRRRWRQRCCSARAQSHREPSRAPAPLMQVSSPQRPARRLCPGPICARSTATWCAPPTSRRTTGCPVTAAWTWMPGPAHLSGPVVPGRSGSPEWSPAPRWSRSTTVTL